MFLKGCQCTCLRSPPPFNINTCFLDLVYLYGKHAVNDKSVILILVASWSSGRLAEFVLNFWIFGNFSAAYCQKSRFNVFFCFHLERPVSSRGLGSNSVISERWVCIDSDVGRARMKIIHERLLVTFASKMRKTSANMVGLPNVSLSGVLFKWFCENFYSSIRNGQCIVNLISIGDGNWDIMYYRILY